MSGITPLLDTLLHQVLGKRVDTAPARSLTEPVRPALPAEAVQSVRSDSRLQPGTRPLTPLPDKKITATEKGAERGYQSDVSRTRMGPAATSSARTHFSTAARAIADLLVRYPAPPSAVRPSAPLLATSEGGHADILAQLLRASIERSGLFYESHLRRWYRGLESAEQLSREPQMRLTRTLLGQSSASGAPASGNGAPSRTAATLPDKGQMRPASDKPESAYQSRIPIDKSASDTLQGLLRHQLEMLASPVLRWEGEVWPGVTMALVLTPLDESPHRDTKGQAEGKPAEDQEKGWQSRLTLRLPDVGEIRVNLELERERLKLALVVSSKETASLLSDTSEPLRERLLALGFEDVLLTVEVQSREE